MLISHSFFFFIVCHFCISPLPPLFLWPSHRCHQCVGIVISLHAIPLLSPRFQESKLSLIIPPLSRKFRNVSLHLRRLTAVANVGGFRILHQPRRFQSHSLFTSPFLCCQTTHRLSLCIAQPLTLMLKDFEFSLFTFTTLFIAPFLSYQPSHRLFLCIAQPLTLMWKDLHFFLFIYTTANPCPLFTYPFLCWQRTQESVAIACRLYISIPPLSTNAQTFPSAVPTVLIIITSLRAAPHRNTATGTQHAGLFAAPPSLSLVTAFSMRL